MIVASVHTPRLLLLYSVSVCGKCVGCITDHIKISNGLPKRGMNSNRGPTEQKSATTVKWETLTSKVFYQVCFIQQMYGPTTRMKSNIFQSTIYIVQMKHRLTHGLICESCGWIANLGTDLMNHMKSEHKNYKNLFEVFKQFY